jgi:tripartite-type tricarboxylate transporter receptor subunit TctC
MKLTLVLGLAPVLAALAASAPAQSQYPARPLRLIVPSAPGGGPDVGSRIIAAELAAILRQNVVVENRPGASTTIGTEAIVRATPDGYTFGQGNFSSLNTTRILMKLPYDTMKDLQPITFAYMSRNLLAINRSLPITSVPELISHAKQHPGKLMYGSSGIGTSMHFSGALFGLLTRVEMLHVPYKATQASITDIIGGQIHLMFDNMSSIVPHVKAGRLRGLAVTSPTRAPSMPDLPSVAEAGVPGFEVMPWAGFVMPAAVPRPIVMSLNEALNKAIASPSVRERLTDLGLEPRAGTPEEFGEFVRTEVAKWSDVAKRANVRLD